MNTNIDEFAINFIYNGFFGAFPLEQHITALKENGFEIIIKLNLSTEKNIQDYDTDIPVLSFPIKDNNVPVDWEYFSGFICYISQIIMSGQKVYIHCKGGHGRSCLVVACILYHLTESMNSRDAIQKTISIHNQRLDLSNRWKNIKSPFSKTQYIFLYKFLNPICILKAYNTGYQAGFSASSLFEIQTDSGVFANNDAAFQNHKFEADEEFQIMLQLTLIKFTMYPELQTNLLLTGIRKIYDYSRYAFGNNLVGKCLMTIRNQYLIEKYHNLNDISNTIKNGLHNIS